MSRLALKALKWYNNRLQSPSWAGGRYYWKPGPNRAYCGFVLPEKQWMGSNEVMQARHPSGDPYENVPVEECTCGIYSVTEKNALLEWASPRAMSSIDRLAVMVEIGGKLLVGEYGFRSEYAMVVAVINIPLDAVVKHMNSLTHVYPFYYMIEQSNYNQIYKQMTLEVCQEFQIGTVSLDFALDRAGKKTGPIGPVALPNS